MFHSDSILHGSEEIQYELVLLLSPDFEKHFSKYRETIGEPVFFGYDRNT
ncbi:hypothetical protein GCM10022289_18460 [Pedobacter jeongneungensis]|uniref:Uncharacterized protein n=1 Tax=Pedobacter jeongneungensis TaxID=947309 RepID=A0ABP8BBJ3_9SPHI